MTRNTLAPRGDGSLSHQEVTKTPREVVEVLRQTDVRDKAFNHAMEALERAAFSSGSPQPLREMYPGIDNEVEFKILAWLEQKTDLSREQKESKQSRNIIAFKAWLLGTPEGRLLTKVNGQYVFASFIEDLFQDWKDLTNEERDIVILKVRRTLAFVVNFIETKLPNRFVKKEIWEIYDKVLWLTHSIAEAFTSNGRHIFWDLTVNAARNVFINNYWAYLSQWHEGMKSELYQTNRKLSHQLVLMTDYQFSGKDKQEAEAIVQQAIDMHEMTLDFRYAFCMQKSDSASPADKLEGLETMIGIFNKFYQKRVGAFGEVERVKEKRQLELEGFNYEVWAFVARLQNYCPHKRTVSASEGGHFIAKTVDAANQAELNAIANILEVLPAESMNQEQVLWVLRNLMGHSENGFAYPGMDNQQAYILRMIDELLHRLESADKAFLETIEKDIDLLDHYLFWVPHHPMHLGLIGSIDVRLANILAIKDPYAAHAWSMSEFHFVRGMKCHNAEEEWADGKIREIVQMWAPFLEAYQENWLMRRMGRPYSVRFIKSEAYEEPLWKAFAGFDLSIESAAFINYETAIQQEIEQSVTAIVREYRAGKLLNHSNTLGFLNRISDAVFQAYDGMFSVKVGEQGSFQGKLGDILHSEEIDIGFGYFLRIEYPIESRSIMERELAPQLEETGMQQGKIYRIVTEVFSRRLHEFIKQSSKPDFFGKVRLNKEEQEWPINRIPLSEQQLINAEHYALYRRLFLENTEESLNFIVLHQNKFHGESIKGAELFIRFQDKETGKYLPLNEAFKFLDLFGVFKEFSRKIHAHLMHWGASLGGYFSVNVRWDELTVADFASFMREKLAEYHVDPKLLTLELLETHKIDTEASSITVENIRKLKELGVRIALDDVGAPDEGRHNNPHVLIQQMMKLGLLTVWDELKFDAYHLKNLQLIKEEAEAIMNSEAWRILKEDEQDWSGITFEKLSNWLKTKEAPDALMVEAIAFFGMIWLCRSKGINVTIERLETWELANIAHVLGLTVQGYHRHRPKEVKRVPLTTIQKQALKKQAGDVLESTSKIASEIVNSVLPR